MAALSSSGSVAAAEEGLSARFGPATAVIGTDVTVRVGVLDPPRAIRRVEIELRAAGESAWTTVDAVLDPSSADELWWVGTFTSTTVWHPGGSKARQPEVLEVRARLLGARGGMVLMLGDLEPLFVDVLSAPEAAARERVLAAYGGRTDEPDEPDAFALTGYVGAEGRAGSSARARVFIGAGGRIGTHLELLAYVSVGPSFGRPALLEGSGPLVLGPELALRAFTRPPRVLSWSPFVELFAAADLRFPGVDPGAGARAGVSFAMGPEVSVEASLGGALVIFRAVDPDGRSAELGASGGLRVALRFGAERAEPKTEHAQPKTELGASGGLRFGAEPNPAHPGAPP